ncbi:MaoC family dehydratase [Halomonas sp.]|uniref:MaoC family dehydratase n=1 Tax=Halomonas sp. TaxID=1486246 RepID=UPI003D14CE48
MSVIAINNRPIAPIYLEDLKVGDITETKAFTVTRDMIISFAKQYDPQPMHLDEDAAHDTIFGELVGSGWQTLAVTMRMLVDARLLGSTPLVGAELKDIRFHAPMRPGDILRASAEIMDIRPSNSRPDRGLMDLRVTTKNSEGMTLVTQSWSLVVPCR